ncbi:MAG: hypothetical protein AB1646_04410 [Thermodesulfobacteriota bacterium]
MFVWLRIWKLVLYLAVVGLFALSVGVLSERGEVLLLNEFASLSQEDPVPKAESLVAEGKVCSALEYLGFFKDYEYVKEMPKFGGLYSQLQQTRSSALFMGSQVLEGLWTGKGDCAEALISATISDFFVVGDVRDLFREFGKRFQGEGSDELTEALAAVGIVLTGVTVFSGGATIPAKAPLSLLKITKKLGKLSTPLEKELVGLFRRARTTGDVKEVEAVAGSLYRLAGNPHLRTHLFDVIGQCKEIKDFARMERMAEAFGNKTAKFLKVGGDAVPAVFSKYGKDKALVGTMDTALQYGPSGARLLGRTGPSKFMEYLKIAKLGARGGRVAHKGHLWSLMHWMAAGVPLFYLYVLTFSSGAVAVGVPSVKLAKAVRGFRRAHA